MMTDADAIRTIILDALHEYDITIPDGYSLADIDDIISGRQIGQIWVVSNSHHVLGVVVVRPMTTVCLELKRLYVVASQRKKGLGRTLLKQALQVARENNHTTIRLETTSIFKEAVRLYRRHGFVELPDADKSPGHDLVFKKRLIR